MRSRRPNFRGGRSRLAPPATFSTRKLTGTSPSKARTFRRNSSDWRTKTCFRRLQRRRYRRVPALRAAGRTRASARIEEGDVLGKLSWQAIPFDQPIPLLAALIVIATVIAVLVVVLVKGWLPYLWREWIRSE